MIQNIVFDMGNVLLYYKPEEYVAELLDDPEERTLMLNELFCSVEWMQLDRGCITEDEALVSVCGRLPERLHTAARSLLMGWHKDIPAFPEMEALIGELKSGGYGVYLLSNANRRFYLYKDKLPGMRWFDGVFISADWRLCKPDPAIYRAFCQHFALTPASCFFIDDMPMNIEAAIWSGMNGFVFRRDIDALRKALGEAGVELGNSD